MGLVPNLSFSASLLPLLWVLGDNQAAGTSQGGPHSITPVGYSGMKGSSYVHMYLYSTMQFSTKIFALTG